MKWELIWGLNEGESQTLGWHVNIAFIKRQQTYGCTSDSFTKGEDDSSWGVYWWIWWTSQPFLFHYVHVHTYTQFLLEPECLVGIICPLVYHSWPFIQHSYLQKSALGLFRDVHECWVRETLGMFYSTWVSNFRAPLLPTNLLMTALTLDHLWQSGNYSNSLELLDDYFSNGTPQRTSLCTWWNIQWAALCLHRSLSLERCPSLLSASYTFLCLLRNAILICIHLYFCFFFLFSQMLKWL